MTTCMINLVYEHHSEKQKCTKEENPVNFMNCFFFKHI